MKNLMEGYNVWSISSRDEATPISSIVLVQDWERRETKAKVLLRISMKESIIPHIRECKMSNETWVLLKGLYETTNRNHMMFLKRKLLSIKMEEK